MAADPDDGILLGEQAKSAIRSYMFKLVVPSAIVISLVSGVGGYVARGLGEAESMKAAFEKLSAPLIEAAGKVATAAEQAKGAADQVKKLAEVVEKSEEQAKKATDNAEKAKTLAQSLAEQVNASVEIVNQLKESNEKTKMELDNLRSANYQKIADELVRVPGFQDKVSKLTDGQYRTLVTQIDQLRSSLGRSSLDVRNIDSRSIRCPDGYYLVGLTFQDQAGLAHGALWGPSATCARLNVGTIP